MATILFAKYGNLTSIKIDSAPARFYSVAGIEINGNNAGFRLVDQFRNVLFVVDAADTVQYNGSTLGGDAEGIVAQLQPVFPDANSGNGGTGWKGQLFQSSTNNVYDNIFSNSLSGAIQWQRVDVGIYTGYLENAFPNYRTRFVYSGYTNQNKYVSIARSDESTITILQTDAALVPVDGMDYFDFEIEVFQSSQLND